MLRYVWLALKRFAVLIPGVIVAYVSLRSIFPFLQHRLPFAAAVFVTYVLGAYLLIPALLRAWRLLVPATHLPLYCITPDGFASDPLNIGLIGSRAQLIGAMEAAGWHVAKPFTPVSVAATIIAVVLKRPYHGTPMSSLYLFGRSQDIGFEKQLIERGRGHRHHVRFWATTLDDIQNIEQQRVHGRSYQEQLIADKLLWVGAASRDVGIALALQTFQLTHAVAPDTNQERDLIVRELTAAKLARRLTDIRLYRSYRLPNYAWSRALRTDGMITILRLSLDAGGGARRKIRQPRRQTNRDKLQQKLHTA